MNLLIFIYTVILLQRHLNTVKAVCIYFTLDVFTEAALNLFINSNSQELLKEMKPTIQKKLIAQMRHFQERLFAQVPIDLWITE